MGAQPAYSYSAIIADAQKVNWRVDDLFGDDARLDFSQPFLPESLARTGELALLSSDEKLILNHIRGATYLHLFELVEEFILPFAIERAHDVVHGDKDRVRALLTFAEEEAKHQQLFRRFAEEFKEGFPTKIQFIGPEVDVAADVLENTPLSVAFLVLHLEWLTQRHYLESVKADEDLDPLFVSLLKHHWQEEAQHTKVDTLVTSELARQAQQNEIEQAIDDFLKIGNGVDQLLQQQVKYDLTALEEATGRRFTETERRQIEVQQLRSYRWTFLVSGLQQENFVRFIAEWSPAGLTRIEETATVLSQ